MTHERNNQIKVSIVTTTYNDALYLDRAIKSVINQTYKNWEFIIINDASTDDTGKNILKYLNRDKRIRYFKNNKRLGIVKNLNRGLTLAKGEFVARLDGDDVWIDSNKLEIQIKYLLNNPEVSLLGSWAYKIDSNNKIIAKLQYPYKDSTIKRYLLIENCFIHSAVIFRKKHVQAIGGYSEDYKFSQDYELWLRLGRTKKIHNLPEYMVGYRINENGISRTKYEEQINETILAVKENKNYYPFYPIALTMWYARRIIPRDIRENLSRTIRRFLT